ncbi:hypothetical protein Vi05172_g9640 [Venturia inaequalis]|nr:hypothetical protein Vi05172_g9640 [Venturia inaequalis]
MRLFDRRRRKTRPAAKTYHHVQVLHGGEKAYTIFEVDAEDQNPK